MRTELAYLKERKEVYVQVKEFKKVGLLIRKVLKLQKALGYDVKLVTEVSLNDDRSIGYDVGITLQDASNGIKLEISPDMQKDILRVMQEVGI